MEFGGDDVDTLALMFDKLQYIFRGYDPYIQAFNEMQDMYKQGKLAERDYYYGITDSVLKYSALEFLGLKAMFEIKKALNRMNNSSPTQTMGANSRSSEGPHSITSFISAKSLPGRDDLVGAMANEKKCTSCGRTMSNTAKFCTTCGNKV